MGVNTRPTVPLNAATRARIRGLVALLVPECENDFISGVVSRSDSLVSQHVLLSLFPSNPRGGFVVSKSAQTPMSCPRGDSAGL